MEIAFWIFIALICLVLMPQIAKGLFLLIELFIILAALVIAIFAIPFMAIAHYWSKFHDWPQHSNDDWRGY